MTPEAYQTALLADFDYLLAHPHLYSTQTRAILESQRAFWQNASTDVLNTALAVMPAIQGRYVPLSEQ